MWVTNAGDDTVSRIDVEPNQVSQTLHNIGSQPSGIVFGDGALWVTDTIAAELLKVDPASGEVPDRGARRPALRRRLHA